jgi:NTE family protein
MRDAKLASVSAVAFEGGGTLGIAYPPVLARLERAGAPVVDVAGSSAGAIIAMLMALGRTARQIQALQEETPWERFAAYRPPALLRLLFCGGWHSSSYAGQWLAARVREAGLPDGATFEALRRRTGMNLYVGTTRYSRHRSGAVEAEPYVFSPALTPGEPVADAVLASMSVPLFWPPASVGGYWHADGGIAMNHPLSIFQDRPKETVLGVRLDSGQETLFATGAVAVEPARPSVSEIITANARMLRALANSTYVPKELWARIVRIDVGDENALDFGRNPARIARLRAAGEKALNEWISTAVAG